MSVPGLLCGVVCMILCLAVSVECRLVTDRKTYTYSLYCTSMALNSEDGSCDPDYGNLRMVFHAVEYEDTSLTCSKCVKEEPKCKNKNSPGDEIANVNELFATFLSLKVCVYLQALLHSAP